jgi:hypothetical protein
MLAVDRGDDGSITLVIYACEGRHVSLISLYDRDGGGDSWLVERDPHIAPAKAEASVHRYRAFELPRDGWTLQEGGSFALRPGRRYAATAVTGTLIPRVFFTTESLDRAKGRLLAGANDRVERVSESTFRRRAADAC